jgi:hypothetical protein
MNKVFKISGIDPSNLKVIDSVAQKASFEYNPINFGTSMDPKNDPFRPVSTIQFSCHKALVENNMIHISH